MHWPLAQRQSGYGHPWSQLTTFVARPPEQVNSDSQVIARHRCGLSHWTGAEHLSLFAETSSTWDWADEARVPPRGLVQTLRKARVPPRGRRSPSSPAKVYRQPSQPTRTFSLIEKNIKRWTTYFKSQKIAKSEGTIGSRNGGLNRVQTPFEYLKSYKSKCNI